MPNPLAQDIAAVRDYIDEHGFNQGTFRASDGSVCIRGAAQEVEIKCGWQRFYSFFYDLIAEELPMFSMYGSRHLRMFNSLDTNGGPNEPIAYYNDKVLRGKQDALNFLDKARIRAEEMIQ